jgi:hypothetical protein
MALTFVPDIGRAHRGSLPFQSLPLKFSVLVPSLIVRALDWRSRQDVEIRAAGVSPVHAAPLSPM